MNEPILLRRHQIDDRAWDALIDDARNSVIYAHSWYLDCVSPDWQALVVVDSGQSLPGHAPISNHAGSFPPHYKIVMPLPVRTKWGILVVQQPLFCQYLGIFSIEEFSEADLARFLRTLSRHFPYISVYDFHPSHTYLLGKLLPNYPDFESQNKATHWLNLEKSYRDLARDYLEDRRKNLKKSRRYSWECTESEDIEPLITLFQENHAAQIENVHASAYALLRDLTNLLQQKQFATLYYAQRQGTLHAGTLIVKKEGMGIYIFNAADEVGRKGNARTYLLDRYFRQEAQLLKTFDFESPEVESIARFYQSFGAERQVFISIKKNKLPFPWRQLQNWRKRWLTST